MIHEIKNKEENKMKIKMEETLILNRAWVYDDPDDDPVATTDFEVPREWLEEVFPVLFPDEDLDDFLDWYEPEDDGQIIYEKAKKDGVIIQESVMPVDEIAPLEDPESIFTMSVTIGDSL